VRFCWAYRYRNQHEARETYKTLKDQNIGNASISASLYTEWAALEIGAGESTYGRLLSGIGCFEQTLQQSIFLGRILTVGPCVWAAGESERALSIVRKGIKADAQPIRYMVRQAPGTNPSTFCFMSELASSARRIFKIAFTSQGYVLLRCQ